MGAISSKINVLITGSAAGLVGATNKASGALGGFGRSLTGTVGKLGTFGAALLTGAAAYGLYALVKGSIQTIDTLNEQAETLGITTDALSRMQYAASFAGIESEALGKSLGKMLVNLDAATKGGKKQAAAFQTLKLNAATLKAASPEDAFAEIAGAIGKVANPAEKAAMAVAIFGKQGLDLIPVLNLGKEGLTKFYKESDKLGNTVKQVDSEKVAAAADAMGRIDKLIAGIGNTLAIELAPYIAAAANALVGMGVSGDGMGAKVVAVIESIAKGIAYVADWVKIGEALFRMMGAVIVTAIGGALKAVDFLGGGLVKLLNLLPGVNLEWTTAIDEMAAVAFATAEDAALKAGEAYDDFLAGASSKKVTTFFATVKANAQAAAEAQAKLKTDPLGDGLDDDAEDIGKVTDALAKLREKVDQFGMSDAAKAGAELAALGATPEQITEAKLMAGRLDALEAQTKATEDLAAAGKEMAEANMTDAEKYASEIERINELLIKGAITKETADRAARAAEETLAATVKEPAKAPDMESPSVLTAGSSEAARFIADIRNKQRGSDKAAEMVQRQDKANSLLKDIRDKDQIVVHTVAA